MLYNVHYVSINIKIYYISIECMRTFRRQHKLDHNNISYRLFIPIIGFGLFPKKNMPLELFIHLIIFIIYYYYIFFFF